ncbi:class E sortase [Actinomyces sp. 2119]|uniref:Class E sortase n=1 Tax=Actinomyces lilanjuaniae TaxID=2321394 RepID=A0ABN5PLT2_9ACTO|nr:MULTISPECIES: class E sortase [Actinomyces]AYD88854.1 class E sortase [Actinomyces lilanjuaniae]RJF43841.1 class E sortase [Actinomyces sp. 2119]
MSRTHSVRPPVQARDRKRGRRFVNAILTGVGELLITSGLVVALFLVWQLWWTGIDASASAAAATTSFEQTQVDSPEVEGTRHYEDPPAVRPVGNGQTIGMLVVPKWYGVTNNNMPVIEGTGSDVLDQAAAGHYPETQQVGEVGNFAVAAHRRTYGNSFRRIDLLEEGDEVIISTADTWYVYTVTSHEIVMPDQVEVLAPVPGEPTATPTTAMLTMTTCHGETTGEWGNDRRWIVHAELSYWMDRSEGRPASVLNDPEVN